MTYREYIQSSFWLIFLIFGSIFTILSFGIGLIITIPMYFASKYDYKNNYLPTMDIYSSNDVSEIFYEISTEFRPKFYVDVFGSGFDWTFDHCDLIISLNSIKLITYTKFNLVIKQLKYHTTPLEVFIHNDNIKIKHINNDNKELNVKKINFNNCSTEFIIIDHKDPFFKTLSVTVNKNLEKLFPLEMIQIVNAIK